MASSKSSVLRSTPFAPKRQTSSASISSTASSSASSLLGGATHKRIKSTLTVDAIPKSTVRPRSRPGSPSKTDRPKTPGSLLHVEDDETSAMDVSRIDPEENLVDFSTLVDSGDVDASVDNVDEDFLKGLGETVKEDKVMVSIRVRPTNAPSAWSLENNSIKLTNSKRGDQEFTFDAILTGSENKPIYTTVARSHVYAAMEGFNSVIFAYGQTASGKTYTLTGDVDEPGIIPRAMKDVFRFIKQTTGREYLLRCSYLEIYNEQIMDLLASPTVAAANPVQIQGGANGKDIILAPLREEVVTSLKGVKEVLRRGEGNRRTACTDWNDRSSRSHSVFRLVIESRERGADGRYTPIPNGRHTPGGSRLQAIGDKSVQTSVLSLIDLAGSEKATSDKDRTREGKYINTSLLTLGSVIGTLAENAAKNKNDHVPFRNSKLTRMLQPSLSGNAKISVVCTINPEAGAITESTSTLLFARRIKGVQLNAKKKEVVDTDALIERYRKEIEELKKRLTEKEAEAPRRNRRLSAREQIDESKAMKDLNARIQQLTKLILTSQSVDEMHGDESRPASPVKVDFDMSPYQLQQELLAARNQLESQARQILSLEASLLQRPPPPSNATENEKDASTSEQANAMNASKMVAKKYGDNQGEAARRTITEDVEKEWMSRVEEEVKKREESEKWAEELVGQLEREKQIRMKLEEEKRALVAFVSMFDSLGLGGIVPTPVSTPKKQAESKSITTSSSHSPLTKKPNKKREPSTVRLSVLGQPSLLDQVMLEEDEWDVSFDGPSLGDAKGDVLPPLNDKLENAKQEAGEEKLGKVENVVAKMGDKENVKS